MKKQIDVGCGVIHDKSKILISQRLAKSNLGGFWEFPGGKREDDETIEECLVREIDEELGIRVQPTKTIGLAKHEESDRVLMLHFILCKFISGSPQKRECQDFQWVQPEELKNFKFPPADADLLLELVTRKKEFFGGE